MGRERDWLLICLGGGRMGLSGMLVFRFDPSLSALLVRGSADEVRLAVHGELLLIC